MSLKEKIKIFLANFRSLPSSTKRLLSLGMVLALVVALPLFVWAIVNQTFDIRKRAATGEPTPTPSIRPTPTPTPRNTPPIIHTSSLPFLFWKKQYDAKIEAYDLNKKDNLTMSVRNLPKGLSLKNCKNNETASGKAIVSCKLSGVPTTTIPNPADGTISLEIMVEDGINPTVRKSIEVPFWTIIQLLPSPKLLD